MIRPPFLQANDTIGIVATARSATKSDLAYAVNLINEHGFQVKLGKSIGLTNHQFAGSDKERAEDFEIMLKDSKIKAIWCAKGGYGSVRILDIVSWELLSKHPKWIIGYSDVTAIHSHVNRLSIMSIHGQMPVGLQEKSAAASKDLFRLLAGELPSYTLVPHHKNIEGKTKARIIGGNLSVLYSLMGSESFPATEHVILFIEDVDEYLYHIDRMMQNLKRNKILSRLAGVVVGGMSDMNDNAIPFGKTAEEIIYEYVADLGIPVIFGFPSGHIYDHRALILGAQAEMNVTKQGVIFSYRF